MPKSILRLVLLLALLPLFMAEQSYALGPPCVYSICASLGSVTVPIGGTVLMTATLYVSSNSGNGTGPVPPTGSDIVFTLNYDARALSISAFPGASITASGKTFASVDISPGRKRISITGANQSLLGNGASLADLLIKAIPLSGTSGSQIYPISINGETGVINTSGIPWGDGQVTVTNPVGLGFVPITPCRLADTRSSTPPSLNAGESRDFIVAGKCGVPATAQAYALNATVVPRNSLAYLTLWPTGSSQPGVSTLNSFAGSIVANAAITPSGNGKVSAFVTDATDLILDINGYFDATDSPNAIAFYPLNPCRVFDTRLAVGVFGGPPLNGGESRSFPLQTGPCTIAPAARAYSTNVTVVPQGPLAFLTAYPTGVQQPVVSTLNSPAGKILANAALLPAGSNGAATFFVTNPSDVILDVNGYFAPRSASGLTFFPVTPCRAVDTRRVTDGLGGPVMAAGTSRNFEIPRSPCGIPEMAKAFSLNITVVPQEPLSYLSAWPAGQNRPLVSTLNSLDGGVVANAAIVPTGDSGTISVYVTNRTHVIMDINGYFAP